LFKKISRKNMQEKLMKSSKVINYTNLSFQRNMENKYMILSASTP
jgi:hypothetical protein